MESFERSPLASAPPAPRASQPLPFASPEQLDPQLQDFLEQASRQLCSWLGSASQRSPLPGLGVLPGVEPAWRDWSLLRCWPTCSW